MHIHEVRSTRKPKARQVRCVGITRDSSTTAAGSRVLCSNNYALHFGPPDEYS